MLYNRGAHDEHNLLYKVSFTTTKKGTCLTVSLMPEHELGLCLADASGRQTGWPVFMRERPCGQ